MSHNTATMRQLLAQIGISDPAELTTGHSGPADDPLLQLVDSLLHEALAELARCERALRDRLRDLDRAVRFELNLLDQGQTPTGLPSHRAVQTEPERFRLAAAVDVVRMVAPLRRRLLRSDQDA